MPKVSKRTQRLLGDELAGSWTLATIEDLFEDAGIKRGPLERPLEVSGARRGLMAEYLASLDLDSDAGATAMVPVFNEALEAIKARRDVGDAELANRSYGRLVKALRSDGFGVDDEAGRIMSGHVELTETALSALSDASAIREHLTRLNQHIDADPRLAVSVAKDMVESTAKLVLTERGVAYARGDELPALVARAQESLGLAASGVDAAAEEARALKRILGSLSGLVQGVTELRNSVGVGHGRESVPRWVRPRHARLAAGAAQTWCQLMLETLEDASAPWRAPRPEPV